MPISVMNTTELAWAAGVYAGEGSASTYFPNAASPACARWPSIKPVTQCLGRCSFAFVLPSATSDSSTDRRAARSTSGTRKRHLVVPGRGCSQREVRVALVEVDFDGLDLLVEVGEPGLVTVVTVGDVDPPVLQPLGELAPERAVLERPQQV